MITKTSILANLRKLDRLYANTGSHHEALFYSKLAILELCGWVEESMDDVILKCSRRLLRERSNLTYVEQKIVRRTYGFEYDQHFRFMLIRLIGIVRVERLEKRVNQASFTRMKSALSNLKSMRDREAHTHLKGAMTTLNAPSVTRTQFRDVFAGLKDIELRVREIRP